MQQVLCSDKKEHHGHKHEVLVIETCSGITDCGDAAHDVHEFEVRRQVWCRGVCNCGLRKNYHGPGDHK